MIHENTCGKDWVGGTEKKGCACAGSMEGRRVRIYKACWFLYSFTINHRTLFLSVFCLILFFTSVQATLTFVLLISSVSHSAISGIYNQLASIWIWTPNPLCLNLVVKIEASLGGVLVAAVQGGKWLGNWKTRNGGNESDGIITPIVECYIRSRNERRLRETHMVWRNAGGWTSERSKAWMDV